MERDDEDEDEDERHACHTSEASCGPKKKTSEKSPATSLDFREHKILPGFPFLRRRFSPACAKAFPRLCEKGWNTADLKKRNGGFCSLYIKDALPSTSRCTCRLNNVHTYQQHIYNIPVTCFFGGHFHGSNVRRLV
jgi:hypothetical protein